MKHEEQLYHDLQHSETRNDLASWTALLSSVMFGYEKDALMTAGAIAAAIGFAILSRKTRKLRGRLTKLMKEEKP